MEVLMQKKFMTFGMALFFCLSFWLCPAWSAEGSAIMAAILENDSSALQEKLKPGVNLNVTDSCGYTPLDIALTHGSVFNAPGMVELLLQHGARPGSGPADSALTLARLLVTQAPLSQLEAALQVGGKVDAALPNGFTAFLWAAALSHDPAVLEALVKAGANPLQVLPGGDVQMGDNALLLAAEYNRNPEIIRFLLRSGLDVNSRSSFLGDSALMVACRANKNPAVVEALVRHGADVNAGRTDWSCCVCWRRVGRTYWLPMPAFPMPCTQPVPGRVLLQPSVFCCPWACPSMGKTGKILVRTVP